MISKEEQINNINREIENFKRCIEDLESYKQFITNVDDNLSINVRNDIKEFKKNFLFVIENNTRSDIYYTNDSHLYARFIKK